MWFPILLFSGFFYYFFDYELPPCNCTKSEGEPLTPQEIGVYAMHLRDIPDESIGEIESEE